MMDRVHKRYFIASLTLHGVLLAVLLFGAAFVASQPQDETVPVLTFIPDIATAGQFAGGGQRGSAPPARQPQPRPPRPAHTVAPPPRRQEQPRTQPKPRHETTPQRPVEHHSAEPVKKPSRRTITLPKSALRTVERTSNSSSTKSRSKRSETEAPSAHDNSRSKLVNRIEESMNRISSGTSASTTVEMPGDGSGGPTYAPYAAIIKSIYTRAWETPEDLHDDQAMADVEVEVARDGTVISGRIIKSSGNVRMDRSVEDVLRRVHFIKEFPSSWKEEKRTFRIRFNLKVKEQLIG